MEQLKNIIQQIKKITEEENLKLTNLELMDFSVRIFNSQKIQKNYSENSKNKSYTSKDEPPTEAQIYTIKKAGKEIPAGLTKREATKIIRELKK